ncbi:hypothetical protein [Sanguibacter sp. HDW7]|uniref:hypothetical protein n=1 Tax=Sanguibacter sp. HDW7 TaxID=2714931 RepID=UPI00140AB50E|nr:hypothetical protein [Sanguibacter sp. HDW7]QIK83002.1 hypothetical protein G7063_04690 [Sanguibacter sp. HDW7]
MTDDLLGPEWHAKVRQDYETADALETVDHVWLNGFRCIRPTDEFAAEVGRMVINKIMQTRDRSVALTFNAS